MTDEDIFDKHKGSGLGYCYACQHIAPCEPAPGFSEPYPVGDFDRELPCQRCGEHALGGIFGAYCADKLSECEGVHNDEEE